MKRTQYLKPLALFGAVGLSLAAANAQSINHVATTRMNVNRASAAAADQFGISVVPGNARYVAAANGTLSATGLIGDGTLLDWQIFTAVNNTPFTGTTISAGSGLYFNTATCADTTAGGPQEWFDVWTTNDISTQPANIGTGLTPAVGNGPTPLKGTVNISGIESGKFFVMHGNFGASARVNMTMTGPGQTPIVLPTYTTESPGSQNRMWLMEFSFANPNGNYYNIQWTVDNNQNNTGRRRTGGIFLDGTLYVDTVEPAWVTTWPNVSPVSGTLFTLNANTNENSIAYYVVLPDGSSAPTSAQVKAGTDASNTPVTFSGNFALNALVSGSKMITGLTASTAYDVYVVAEDVRGPNLQALPVLVEVTTTAPDVTAPGWTATYPQQSRTPAGLTGIGNMDEPGTAYFVALPSGASAPTSAQVKAGTDAADATAPSGSMALLTPGISGTKTIAGLTIGTTYDVWFVAEDLEGNLQAAPTSIVSAPVAPVSQFATGGFAWGTASVWSGTTLGPYNGPWGAGNNAVFEGGASVIPVVSGTVVNNMTFSNSFILQGGPLTLAGTTQPTITVTAGIPKLEVALAGTQGFIKAGSGTLQMTGSNSLTGGIVISEGFLGDNGGAPGTVSLNNNDITANGGTVGLTVGGGATTNGGITLTSGTLRISNNNSSFTVNGAVTGPGGIELNKTGLGSNTLNLNSTSNNFTGGVNYTNDLVVSLNVNSFADATSLGAGDITFGSGNGTAAHNFAYGSGAIAAVTLDNRQFKLAGTGATQTPTIKNNSSFAFTIKTQLLSTATGTRTLSLGGTGSGLSTFGGKITNGTITTLNLIKADSGTWALSGGNDYNGTTTVSAGTLLINGNQSLATAAIAVNGTSTLGGSGTIGGTVTTAATANIAPGNAGAGTLNIAGNLNIAAQVASTGKLNFQLDALASTNDKIAVTGILTIGVDKLGFNDFVFTNLGGLQVTLGTPYKLITSGGINPGDTLDPANLEGALPGGFIGALQITGNDIELVVTPNTAPTISDITDQTVPSGIDTGVLDFTITDEFVNTVTPSGSSSNITLVPNTNIVFGGSAENRTVTVTPAPGQSGTATITITVTDSGGLTATDTFELTVTPGNKYASWANDPLKGNIPGELPAEDFDKDGIANIIEYALGLDPRVSSVPAGDLTGNTITYTKGADAIANGDVRWIIETSETLLAASWTDAVTQNAGDTNPTISYTFTPSTPLKKFARLKVVQLP